jgi:hypothetical protein
VNAATDLHPEVAQHVDQFLTRVREQLADLTQDERDELLDGLEADLSEQLSEGDAAALPDPASYAAELRSAAGLPARRATRSTKVRARTFGAHLVAAPDTLRAHWLRLTQRNDASRRVWSLLVAVRPAWWVLRAWIAVTFLDAMAGDAEYVTLVPSLGVTVLGPAVLVAAIVLSVLMGQGQLWPGSGPDRPLAARLTLAGLNVFAILLPLSFTVPVAQPFVYAGGSYNSGYYAGSHRPGLRIGADVVRNIYAYDAEGRPLKGVQLIDQLGRPVAVSPESSMGRGRDRQVTCPWFNGTTPLFNVFPLPQRTQPRGTCLTDTDPAKVGEQVDHEPPLASLPPATLPAAP